MIDKEMFLKLQEARNKKLNEDEIESVKELEKNIDNKILECIESNSYNIDLSSRTIEKCIVGKALKNLVIQRIIKLYSDYDFNYYSDLHGYDLGYTIKLKK